MIQSMVEVVMISFTEVQVRIILQVEVTMINYTETPVMIH